jgi:iron(III) transport system substrate-binding protein
MKINKSAGIALTFAVAAFAAPAIAADIVMYDALDFAAIAAKAFTAKTGVTVDIVEPGGTGETLGKIAAEGDNPKFDIVWVDGSAVMERMMLSNVLQPVPADVYTTIKYNDLGKSLIPASRAFVPTGASTTAIEVNTKKVPADQMPKSWADLEKFAGSVAAKDPNLSGPMYQWLAGVFQTEGADAGKAMLAKVLTNKALSGVASGGPVDKSVLTGDAKVGINQDSSIFAKMASGEPVVAIYPTEGSVALPASIGVSAKTQHMDAIKKFIAFMTSPEGQAAMMNGSDTDFFFIPVIQGISTKPGRKTDIPFVVLNDKLASAHETEWKTWYKDNFVQ